MEKVFIQSAVNTGKFAKNGNPIIEVILGDGRTGSCMDLRIIPCIGQTIEAELAGGKEYKGVMKYFINLPKDLKPSAVASMPHHQSQPTPQASSSFAERQAALDLAMKYDGRMSASGLEDVFRYAETILNWLRK